MAYNVNFLKGTAQSFADLAVKSKNTFYYIDDKDLYIGDIKLTNGADLNAAVLDIAKNKGDIDIIKAQIEDLTGGEGGDNPAITELISELSRRISTAEARITSEIERAEGAESQIAADLVQTNTNLTELTQLVETNETDIEGKLSTLSERVDANETNIASTSSLASAVAATVQEQASTITTIQGDISDLEGIVDTLVGADSNKSVRAIAIEVLAEQLLADGMTENFASLQELAAWLADHPEEAAEMNAAIQANTAAIQGLQGTINSQGVTIQGLIDSLNAVNDETTGVLALAKKHTTEEVQKVSLELSSYKTNTDVAFSEVHTSLNNTSNSLTQVQEKLNELQKNLGTAAYKSVEDFEAAGSAAAALNEAKAYTDAALTWGEIK